MDEYEEEVCGLCGGTGPQVEAGWFGSSLPLCKSCRTTVVSVFQKRHPKVEPGPTTFYSHTKPVRRGPGEYLPRLTKPWPYYGREARAHEDTYTYYRRMREFIQREAARPESDRKPYLTAAAASRQSARRKTDDVAVPTKKLGPKAQAEADQRQQRQLMLFEDFPP